MSDERPTKKPFLLGQRLSRLSDKIPLHDRMSYVCGSTGPRQETVEKPWLSVRRSKIVDQARSSTPPKRQILVCNAGLGKTTNMWWLQAQIAKRGSRQVPLLLRLHTQHDLDLLFAEKSQSGSLLDHVAADIKGKIGGDQRRHWTALTRYQDQGRITLLIDDLDHAIS